MLTAKAQEDLENHLLISQHQGVRVGAITETDTHWTKKQKQNKQITAKNCYNYLSLLLTHTQSQCLH